MFSLVPIATSHRNPSWHGHVSAISVAPEFRRTGVANRLMEYLEEEGCFKGSTTSHDFYMGIFVDFKSRMQSRRLNRNTDKSREQTSIPNIDVVVILDIFRYFGLFSSFRVALLPGFCCVFIFNSVSMQSCPAESDHVDSCSTW